MSLSLHMHVASDWWMQICYDYIGRPQRLEPVTTTGRISISDPNPNSPAKTTGTNPIGVGPSFGESKLNLTFCTAPWICVEPHPCYCCAMPKKCYISMEECRANCLNCDPKCPAAQTTWEGRPLLLATCCTVHYMSLWTDSGFSNNPLITPCMIATWFACYCT